MTGSHDRLSAADLRAALVQHPFVNEVDYRPRLGSTNDRAKERASAGAPEGLLVITDEQTAGRGRRGRRWWAPAGSALLTSLLFRPALASQQFGGTLRTGAKAEGVPVVQLLNMLCAVAAADAVTDLTSLPVDLKWPNDLIVRNRKLAGLLVESIFRGAHLEAVVVGLGINVNTDFADAPPFVAPATSLRHELRRPVDPLVLLIAYLDGVARRYAQLKQGISPYDEWASRLATLGQHVTVRLSDYSAQGKATAGEAPPRILCGVAEGVDADGALLLRTADGTVHRLLAADVSLGHQTSPKVPRRAADD